MFYFTCNESRIYESLHTHTHTHIYIYIFFYIYYYFFLFFFDITQLLSLGKSEVKSKREEDRQTRETEGSVYE